jgi:RNA polymerase sigma factor
MHSDGEYDLLQHRVNIKRTAMELRLELDRPPTNNEIMQRLGIPADRFRDIQRTNMRTLSLHEHDRITGRERVENLVDNEDVMSAVANKTSMLRYGMDDVVNMLYLSSQFVSFDILFNRVCNICCHMA